MLPWSLQISHSGRRMYAGVLIFLLLLTCGAGIYFWFRSDGDYPLRMISPFVAASVCLYIASSLSFIDQIAIPRQGSGDRQPPSVEINSDNLFVSRERIISQVCLPEIRGTKIEINCSNMVVGHKSSLIADCIKVGEIGSCVDKSAIISLLEKAAYAFNRIDQMSLGDPETVALVVDTSGSANFDEELKGFSGTVSKGATPISLKMEAELVGPAFTIDPEGRQLREISTLNPTRWEWEVTPDREGQHSLEVSLYVVLTSEGEKISEDKPLAERQVVTVTVSHLERLVFLAQKMDPLRAFIVAIFVALAGALSWFGFRSWKDVSRRKPPDDKPQKVEVTIKHASDDSEDDKKEQNG